MAEIPPSDRGAPRYSDEQFDEIVVVQAVIEQANGVLMHTYGVDAAEAVEMLRSRARGARIAVHELAEQIVIYRLAEILWG